MSKRKTAVEWLVEQVNSDCLNSAFIRPDLIKEAIKMERFQIEGAYNDGAYDSKQNQYKGMHEYYNETHGGVNEKDN
jgi:hypothetical protein